MLKYAATRDILKKIDRLYNINGVADLECAILYSKLAHLEFCGWIEESFDEIAHNCVRKHLPNIRDRNYIIEKIGNTHGFEFKSKAKPLLIHCLGVVKYLKVEKALAADGSLDALKGMLGTFNAIRKEAAHTSISSATVTYPSPSVTIANFSRCLPILQRLWVLVAG